MRVVDGVGNRVTVRLWEQVDPVPPGHFRDRHASAQKAADTGGGVGWLMFAIILVVILVQIAVWE